MNFPALMRNYCAKAGWTTAEISERKLRISFDMETGRRQTLYIILFDDTLEFSVQSALYFDSESELPHRISTDLMRKSCTNKVGMWVIEEIQGKYIYSLMHNCSMSELTSAGFEFNIDTMIRAVDKFDGAIQALVGGNQGSSSFGDEFGRAMARGAGQKLGVVAVGALLSLLTS